ncbi:alpha/beta fold hydrolase [Pacificimonas sp. WHA3]|uniref:Alpha/beta fold hydrolase n=2 Tax=Pacificimonas pallii TaxID=2827236 RepID=A0ABS6SEA9_9SPHN|nr:alpha/beta fold hydrolase [Pacificimonas pallii]MBV7256745.1 alpha/beta fold hydrolase [Pacificimonas pallii]
MSTMLGHEDVRIMPRTEPDAVIAYGDAPMQMGELRLPDGDGPFPIAVVIHGGCWTRAIGATQEYMAPLAAALTAEGIATWNVSYRQLGDEGAGWPGTFLDWGRAVDHVRILAQDYPLDLDRVSVFGHSAGAHAALFAAARHRLPQDSEIRDGDPLRVQAAVAIDGPGDLARGRDAAAAICGTDGIAGVMGGLPDEQPGRYAQGSPVALLPSGVRQLVVASVIMPHGQGADYAAAVRANGDDVTLIAMENAGHFNMIAPGTSSWDEVMPVYLQFARMQP